MTSARLLPVAGPLSVMAFLFALLSPARASDTDASGAVGSLRGSSPDQAKAAQKDAAPCPQGHDAYAEVKVIGLKDQRGDLRVELYPDTQEDFVVNMLDRVEIPTPPDDPTICIALPKPGRYAIVVHHDRNTNNKFDLFTDGFGFSNNPKLGFTLPRIDKVAFVAGSGITRLTVDVNYFWSRGSRRKTYGPGR